jgi:hypothetical protein
MAAFIEEKKRLVEEWMKRQPPQVEVAAATASGAAQGALIGGMMATFSSMEPPPGPAGMPPPPKPPGLVGGPLVLARNFAVMTGVNAGLQSAIKKARGGVEDVQGRCGRGRTRGSASGCCNLDADTRLSTQHGRLFWCWRGFLSRQLHGRTGELAPCGPIVRFCTPLQPPADCVRLQHSLRRGLW